MMSGMPMMAPMIVAESTKPTIMKTNPRMTATNLPVAPRMSVTRRQRAQNGQRYQGTRFLGCGFVIFTSAGYIRICRVFVSPHPRKDSLFERCDAWMRRIQGKPLLEAVGNPPKLEDIPMPQLARGGKLLEVDPGAGNRAFIS